MWDRWPSYVVLLQVVTQRSGLLPSCSYTIWCVCVAFGGGGVSASGEGKDGGGTLALKWPNLELTTCHCSSQFIGQNQSYGPNVTAVPSLRHLHLFQIFFTIIDNTILHVHMIIWQSLCIDISLYSFEHILHPLSQTKLHKNLM